MYSFRYGLRVLILCVSAATAAGCSFAFDQYLERKDSITFAHGDAVATNVAVQTADPWPRGSRDNNIPMDPVKAERAIQQYRMGDYDALTGMRGGSAGGGGFSSNGGYGSAGMSSGSAGR